MNNQTRNAEAIAQLNVAISMLEAIKRGETFDYRVYCEALADMRAAIDGVTEAAPVPATFAMEYDNRKLRARNARLAHYTADAAFRRFASPTSMEMGEAIHGNAASRFKAIKIAVRHGERIRARALANSAW